VSSAVLGAGVGVSADQAEGERGERGMVCLEEEGGEGGEDKGNNKKSIISSIRQSLFGSKQKNSFA
jgi:hypothetical protein